MGHLSLNDRINQIVEGTEEALASTEIDSDDIRIAAPREPEVDPKIYRDVESLIVRGFLVLPANINGVKFVFKSMNHREFEYVSWVAGPVGDDSGKSIEHYYNAFMAYGVFMVDGHNILRDRDYWIPILQDTFAGIPAEAKAKVIRYLSELNQKAGQAVILTEAYQVEAVSRYRWKQFKGLDLMSPSCTGIEGTDKIGLNYAQLVWRALNQYEDQKESAEVDWTHAKFIGSCFVGKEIQKIYNQDKDRLRKEREEKIKRRDKLIRQVVLRESPEEAENRGRYIMQVARTADELADQLEKSLRGEKDWHDEVVAKEEARIHAQRVERQQKLQVLVEEKSRDIQLPYQATTNLEGLSLAEVQERIQRKKQLGAQQAASRMVFPEMQDERLDHLFEKYIDSNDTYQLTGVQSRVGLTNRDTSGIQALPPPRPHATPFRR